ncbi:cyclic nucleotide-binding domain-containing protein [candidate division KSB1 bacterium]|nr:cyclic nucleotide-binding domain-containing protein [candidate division KSB1 bacterium]
MNEEILNSLIYIPLFDKLDTDELKFIASYMQLINLKEGEIAFKEGDVGDFVCFVVDGKLEVTKRSNQGGNVVLAKLSKGRSIGEMSIIDSYRRSATVKAISETKLVTLSQYGFETIINKFPKTGIKILKELARLLSLNLRSTSSRFVDSALPPREVARATAVNHR